MSFGGPEPAAAPPLPQVPESPAPPPAFGQAQKKSVGQRPQKKSMQPTFLGAAMTPQQTFSGKTLLGQ